MKTVEGSNDVTKPGSAVKPPGGVQTTATSTSDGSSAAATAPGVSAVSQTGGEGTTGATAATSGTAAGATGATSAVGNATEPGAARTLSGDLVEPPPAGYLMPGPPGCGYRNVTGTRIVGGTESEIGEYRERNTLIRV